VLKIIKNYLKLEALQQKILKCTNQAPTAFHNYVVDDSVWIIDLQMLFSQYKREPHFSQVFVSYQDIEAEIMFVTLLLKLLIFVGTVVTGQQSKLDGNFLDDLALKMTSNIKWRSFCISLVTDMEIEPVSAQGIVPIVQLRLDSTASQIKNAKKTCPHVIIGAKKLKHLMYYYARFYWTITSILKQIYNSN
jgi:hypothetical protein